MTDGQPTESIPIDNSPTQPIPMEPNPTMPVPVVHSDSSGPAAIVPPPFAPPAMEAASSPATDPFALSPADTPTTALPLCPPVVAPSVWQFGYANGSDGGSLPPSADEVAALRQHVSDLEAANKRRTRVAFALGALAIAIAVGASIAIDSWNDNRTWAERREAVVTDDNAAGPSDPLPTTVPSPTTTPEEPSGTADDDWTRFDDPDAQLDEFPVEDSGDAWYDATAEEWLDGTALTDMWDELKRLEEEYLGEANAWLDGVLGGA